MPKVKAAKTSKIQFVPQDFPEVFIKSPINESHRDLCSCAVSCNKRCLLEYVQTPKSVGADLNY